MCYLNPQEDNVPQTLPAFWCVGFRQILYFRRYYFAEFISGRIFGMKTRINDKYQQNLGLNMADGRCWHFKMTSGMRVIEIYYYLCSKAD